MLQRVLPDCQYGFARSRILEKPIPGRRLLLSRVSVANSSKRSLVHPLKQGVEFSRDLKFRRGFRIPREHAAGCPSEPDVDERVTLLVTTHVFDIGCIPARDSFYGISNLFFDLGLKWVARFNWKSLANSLKVDTFISEELNVADMIAREQSGRGQQK